METGQSANSTIDAWKWWNDTGIQLISGELYHFQAVGEWVDWFVSCNADGYASVNLVQRMSESLR